MVQKEDEVDNNVVFVVVVADDDGEGERESGTDPLELVKRALNAIAFTGFLGEADRKSG